MRCLVVEIPVFRWVLWQLMVWKIIAAEDITYYHYHQVSESEQRGAEARSLRGDFLGDFLTIFPVSGCASSPFSASRY